MNMRFRAACRGLAALVLALCFAAAPAGAADAGKSYVNGIDAAAMDSAPAEDAMRKGKAIKEAGEFAKGDVFAVAMRKDDAELARLVNEGYRLLMADPYWKELQAKYFGNN